MLIRHAPDIPRSEITPKSVYLQRRELIARYGRAWRPRRAVRERSVQRRCAAERSPFSTDETPTRKADATSYNNFYEFGTDKAAPAANAGSLGRPRGPSRSMASSPSPRRSTLEDILKPVTLEERIYRLRCVEGWSMVIPWVGFPLADLIKRVEPVGSASTSPLKRSCALARCRASAACSSRCRGPIAKACAWTKPCIR